VHPNLRERLESCEAVLRAHLDPDERVIAIGRCEDITDRGVVPRVVPSPPRKPGDPPEYLVLRPRDQ